MGKVVQASVYNIESKEELEEISVVKVQAMKDMSCVCQHVSQTATSPFPD